MTRAQALAFLKAEFADPADDLGWVFSDATDEGRFASALDAALRDLDVPEDALATAVVPDTGRADLLVLLRWRALEAFTRAFALAVDVSGGDPQASKNYSQRYRAYQKLLDDARRAVEARGFGPADAWELGYLANGSGTGGEYA